MLLLGFDRAVGEGLRRDKKLFEIGLLPGIGEARRVDRGAFGAPLDADRTDERRRFGRPIDHWAITTAPVGIARLPGSLASGAFKYSGRGGARAGSAKKPKLGNKNDVQSAYS